MKAPPLVVAELRPAGGGVLGHLDCREAAGGVVGSNLDGCSAGESRVDALATAGIILEVRSLRRRPRRGVAEVDDGRGGQAPGGVVLVVVAGADPGIGGRWRHQ